MTARIKHLFGPDVHWHLIVLHCWQLALACFWLGGAM